MIRVPTSPERFNRKPGDEALHGPTRERGSVLLTYRLERYNGSNVRNDVQHLFVGQFPAVTVHRGEQDAVAEWNEEFPIGFGPRAIRSEIGGTYDQIQRLGAVPIQFLAMTAQTMLLVNSFPGSWISTGRLSGRDGRRNENESNNTDEEGFHVPFLSISHVIEKLLACGERCRLSDRGVWGAQYIPAASQDISPRWL